MPINLSQLEDLIKANGLKYFKDEEHKLLILPFRRRMGNAIQILIRIDSEGQFLQLRSNDLPSLSHSPNLLVLRDLAALNYQNRWIKFGFDPSDGEVVAYGDMWVMDGHVTVQQIGRMVQNFVGCLDGAISQIRNQLSVDRFGADMSDRFSGSADGSLN